MFSSTRGKRNTHSRGLDEEKKKVDKQQSDPCYVINQVEDFDKNRSYSANEQEQHNNSLLVVESPRRSIGLRSSHTMIMSNRIAQKQRKTKSTNAPASD